MEEQTHQSFLWSAKRLIPGLITEMALQNLQGVLAISFEKPSQKNMMPILVSHFTSVNNLKNSDAIHHKTEIKTVFSKGNILFQLQKGAENRTEYVRKQNRDLMKTKTEN